jgi:hypothetical protein
MRYSIERLKAGRWFSWGKNTVRLVDFIVCGTQKGGTTALDACLREHPEICMARKKEVHFFDNEDFFRKNRPDYARYHAAFDPCAPHKIVGEATPSYMYWRDAPRRIWEYNAQMKMIVLLRNPIERAYSHWNMQRQKQLEPLSFWDALHREQERCRSSLPYQNRRYSYVDRGFYLEQLRRLWEFFQKDQILILKNEDLRHDPRETMRKVCAFLGVSVSEGGKVKRVHVRAYASGMAERERQYLQSIYEFEIRQLERVLDWDCQDWLTGG